MNVQRDPTARELYEALKAIAEDPAREHLLDLPIYADADSGYVLFGNIVSTGHALFIETDDDSL